MRLAKKNWLGRRDIARLLQVSVRTVQNLWTSGRLVYRCVDNKQRTRKSSLAMIYDYQKRMFKY